ncbi:MAG: protein FxsA [Actinomycetota bacterium]|nr:protein FxsA [Actinomycetota bacterium]MDQ1499191.1 protein FxsA [Actinomycetota bacterium]MDQ1502787.1 protein FxsA [Actinomycetota bacterium]MDQ1565233.1 protein FxsA [Actinomycetota bacterium]
MVPLLVILFIGVPFAELYVLIQVGHAIGVLNTLGLLLLVSIVGAWLAKREGIGVIRRMQAALNAGRVPGAELVDGFLILLAAALMLTPGFLTDIVAIFLLLPPVRAVVRRTLRRSFARRIEIL